MLLPLTAFFTGGGSKDLEVVTVEHQPSGSTGYTGFIASGQTGGPIGSITSTPSIFANLEARSGEVGNGVVTEIDFIIVTNQELSQDEFRYLIVQAKNNTIRIYQSADATFGAAGGISSWRWGDGSDVVWDSGEDGLQKNIVFVR